MTEDQFRNSQVHRDELRKVLTHGSLREAISIIINKRRILEAQTEIGNLSGDALQSLRLFNQRLGMEGLILDLHEFCHPIPVGQSDPVADFGKAEEMRKLNELYDHQNL
jgi:hypothetical protein